jgi:hypothetical protein
VEVLIVKAVDSSGVEPGQRVQSPPLPRTNPPQAERGDGRSSVQVKAGFFNYFEGNFDFIDYMEIPWEEETLLLLIRLRNRSAD